MDWLKASATAQGEAIMNGVLDPVEQAEAYLDAARAHPYGERIYARLTPERARAEAIAAHDRAKAGLRQGALDGVALSWKDNVDTAGIATEAGSKLLEGRLPAADAPILARATQAGLVCLGKTHMTELAFSGVGINPATANVPNAYDPALVAGGSSGGAAVSVALGLCAAAIGTDTGGSIRLPAAWNGVVGFKPTVGQLPVDGLVPLCPRYDAPGPLARTVEDCAEVFAVMKGETAVDLRGADIRGLRLMVLDGLPFEDAREAPVAAFEDAVARLAKAGAVILHGAPESARAAMRDGSPLYAAEAWGIWREQIEAAPDVMHPPTLARFRIGAEMSGADYAALGAALERHRAEWAEAVAGVDAVILPTSAITPPPIERSLTDQAFFTSENLMTLRNTRIGNVLGLPGISLPTGHPACGIMAMGAANEDRRLLRVAAAMEAALAV
ncbi:amidase [Paracoccus sp. S-4012]|uniref:amidase n=1 Tax=Paracoccus sp. S-4012 TaxID=2665648 RepID=UPI0012AFFB3A|nr:amidase [Paracoccus sp. S-4012]MRX51510.1 amidase [Paracoccus sp. S-4012]